MIGFIRRIAVSVVVMMGFAPGVFAQSQTDIPPGVGVTPHQKFHESLYRASGFLGVNAGLINDAPSAFGILGQYQQGRMALTGGFLGSASTGGLRRNWLELDALYGYAWNAYDFGLFSESPAKFTVTASVGVSMVTYDERYRRSRFFDPMAPPPDSLPPNRFDVAPGIPLQLQAIYQVNRYAGITALAYLNINRIYFSYGMMVGVTVGLF